LCQFCAHGGTGLSVATLILKKCEGEDSHSQNGSLGVHWDSQTFRERLQGSKHLTLKSFYIIGKLLKSRCLKWDCMTHLDICNTIYGKKKGRESHWQFYSQPQKVGNQPDPMRAGGVQHTIGKILM